MKTCKIWAAASRVDERLPCIQPRGKEVIKMEDKSMKPFGIEYLEELQTSQFGRCDAVANATNPFDTVFETKTGPA